jgi:hypothetical protein
MRLDEWQLADSETVKVKGTPVIVFVMILERLNHGCN